MAEKEGVIQYRLDFSRQSLPDECRTAIDALNKSRSALLGVGLVGQDDQRYDGLGFGNLSLRMHDGFLVTGTQTGQKSLLSVADFAWVDECVPVENRLTAHGLCAPSSEAMTHGVLYALDLQIQAIVHVHSPNIWRFRQQLALSETSADITYGTPAMAVAVELLWPSVKQPSGLGVFAMAGHEDGIMAAGPDLYSVTDGLLLLEQQAEQYC